MSKVKILIAFSSKTEDVSLRLIYFVIEPGRLTHLDQSQIIATDSVQIIMINRS